MKMKRFILGFQRRVWCPKWTPASSRSFIAISATASLPMGFSPPPASLALANPSPGTPGETAGVCDGFETPFYRLLNWNRLRAPGCPYFLRSFMRSRQQPSRLRSTRPRPRATARDRHAQRLRGPPPGRALTSYFGVLGEPGRATCIQVLASGTGDVSIVHGACRCRAAMDPPPPPCRRPVRLWGSLCSWLPFMALDVHGSTPPAAARHECSGPHGLPT
jgi:hypothetical protein